jgi:hypothetical protein
MPLTQIALSHPLCICPSFYNVSVWFVREIATSTDETCNNTSYILQLICSMIYTAKIWVDRESSPSRIHSLFSLSQIFGREWVGWAPLAHASHTHSVCTHFASDADSVAVVQDGAVPPMATVAEAWQRVDARHHPGRSRQRREHRRLCSRLTVA